ncbi:MAG: hypothetical protein JWP35_3594 [Caulobacter sp.]|nr:hypothetical protein [Caulobacter sp.]
MIRTIAAGVTASLLFSAAAFAAPVQPAEPTVRVSLAGKSTAEAHAAIVKAASAVCFKATRGEQLFVYVYPSCVTDAVNKAIAQTGDAKLAAYKGDHSAVYAGR